MTMHEPPLPHEDPRPETDRAPGEELPNEPEVRQEAPGEDDGPKQQARAMFASAFGAAGVTGEVEESESGGRPQATGGYTGGMAAGDGGAAGMRDIVADEADEARRRGQDEESPANEAQADA